MKLLPEQLLVHARVWVGRGEPLPYQIGAPLVIAFDEALEEIKRLRERIVVLEQERFE